MKVNSLSTETWMTLKWDPVSVIHPVGGNIWGYKLYYYNETISDFVVVFNGEELGLPS